MTETDEANALVGAVVADGAGLAGVGRAVRLMLAVGAAVAGFGRVGGDPCVGVGEVAAELGPAGVAAGAPAESLPAQLESSSTTATPNPTAATAFVIRTSE